MTQKELIAKAAEKAQVSQKEAEAVIKAAADAIKNAVTEGDSITIFRFGTFKRTLANARTGVNPQTGEKISIPAHYAPKFQFSASVKDAVRDVKVKKAKKK